MVTKSTNLLPLLLFLALLSATSVLSHHTSEKLKGCMQQCEEGHRGEEQELQCKHMCKEQYKKEEPIPGVQEEALQACMQKCEEGYRGQEQEQESQCKRMCKEQYARLEPSPGRHEEDDPSKKELKACMQKCEEGYQGQEQEQESQCKRMCKEQYASPGRHEEDDPSKKELKHCKDKCEDLGRPRKGQCELDCEEKHRRRDGNSQGEGDENPYFFGRDRFKDWMSSQHGKIQILERFDKRSDLLAGIANYRVKILEAEPHTFVVPKHTDAEELFYVGKGEGVINLLRENNRETHDLQQGDIFRVPAGTIMYIINKHNQEKLCLIKLLQPVSTPGRFKTFFDAGGENPESYLRSFSDEVKQAAFNAPPESFERAFGKQSKGVIMKASKEQIKQLSSSSSEGHAWPFGGGESQQQKPFNLLKKEPSQKNKRGEHYEADESDYKQLRELDVQISYANITRGSMMAPFFNSRATKVSVVVSGKGFVEIVCPHLASQQSKSQGKEHEHGRKEEQGQEKQQGSQQGQEKHQGQKEPEQQAGQQYQRARADLSPGTVVVTPAGHPSAWIASRDENLEVVCFEINSRNNQRYWLAGNNSILKKMEKVAKELAFGTTAKEVDALLDAQEEKVFLPGPGESKEGRGHEGQMESVLDFVGFFV